MKENKGSALEVYDRMHGSNISGVQTSIEWEFKCIYCGHDKIDIGVLDTCFRNSTIRNFDDLPEKEVKYYKSLLDEVKVVLEALNNKKEMCTRCHKCGLGTVGFYNRVGSEQVVAFPQDKKLRDYLYKHYNYEEVIEL